MAGWSADPMSRHQERWHDGATWTSRVRDHGIENDDPAGLASIGASTSTGAMGGTGFSSIGHAAGTHSGAVPVVATNSGSVPVAPVIGPPPSMTPTVAAYPGLTAPGSGYGRPRPTGLPGPTATSLVFAGATAVYVLVIGLAMTGLGSAMSDSAFASEASSDITTVGSLLMLGGGAMLAGIVAAVMGRRWGWILTLIFLGLAELLAMATVADGESPLLLVAPALMLWGLLSPSSRLLYTDS